MNVITKVMKDFDIWTKDISASTVLHSLPDAVFITDPQMRISYFNLAAEKLTGFKSHEALGMYCKDILKSETCETECSIKRALDADKNIFNIETTIVTATGQTLPILSSALLIKDATGNIFGYLYCFRDISVLKKVMSDLEISRAELTEKNIELTRTLEELARDITERKHAEEALHESERRLARSQEIAHLGSWELDLISKKLAWSDEVYRIFGLQRQDFRATYEAFLEAVHPDDRAAVDAAYSDSLSEGRDAYEIEHRIVRKSDGIIRIVHEKCEHIRDSSGQIIRSVGMVQDITERKRVEEALRDSEEQYRLLFNGITDAVYVHEVSVEKPGKFFAVNDSACKMLGYTRDEFMKMEVKDIDIPEQAEKILPVNEKLFRDGYATFEGCHVAKDGKRIPVEVNIKLFKLQGKSMVLAVARDITKRKRTEKMLEKKSEEQSLLLDNIPTLIWYLTDVDTQGVVNKACADFFGKNKEDLENKKLHDIMSEAEAEFCTAGNKEVFEKRVTIHTEEWARNSKGERRLIAITKTPKIGENGNVEYVVCSGEDITEHRQAEEELKRAEQLKVAGDIAVGLTHELKNSLAGLKLSTEVLLDELALSEDNKGVLLKMISEIQRIEFLMRDILYFARPRKPLFDFVNINMVLDTAISFSLKNDTGPLRNKPIKMIKEFDENLPETMADLMQLQQVFMNLLINAIESVEKGGVITVKTRYEPSDNSIQISIADTGKGINNELKEKIFEPFFTTKPRGTGLGLPITKRLVEQHGGNIRVETSLGKGTTFNVALPVKKTILRVQDRMKAKGKSGA
jgi:PAS domain S-box-containing protein